LEVARGRLARECDGQTEFPEFGEEPEILSIGDRAMGEQPAAEAAALARSRDVKRTAKVDPLSPCPDLRLKSAALQTSDLRLKDDGVTSIASALQRSQVSRTEHGQTDEDSAVPGITTIGGLANGILSQLPTPIARLQQIRELSARIYQEVGDPKFHREKADELAEAIVDGRWTERLYNRVLMSTRKAFAGETRSGIPRVPRWAYFLGAALNSIKENDPRGR
jgi:hypothetical protein